MHLGSKPAGRHKLIDVLTGSAQHAVISPELRRTFSHQDTPQAFGFFAVPAVKFPENMHWANQPMLVGSIYFNRLAGGRPQSHDFRTQKRDVMVMDHIVGFARQDLLDPFHLQIRPARLLSEQGGEPAVSALQPMPPYIWVLLVFNFRFCRVLEMVSVDAVNDIHLVSCIAQGMRQPVDIHRVSTEAVGWVKGSKVQKVQRPGHH
jgi:hypothetical protein